MSQNWFQDVLEFHRKLAPDRVGTTPAWPDPECKSLVNRLVIEEWNELAAADETLDLPETADATIDLIYVLLGRLVTLGIDGGAVWDAVHAANMAKEGGGRRADHKILKPPGWTPPDVAGILARQLPLRDPAQDPVTT